ncbi:MAG TPA: DUF2905 domain-containing protein [Terriglobia bacterium]|nr:DUF2905 domain-containing protein [Terriglobia bacterium]
MSEPTRQLGTFFVIAGVVLIGIGLFLFLSSRFSFMIRLGKLPGDIAFRGKNTTFYFPIVTCLLISAVLTLVLWLVSFFSRR